MAEREAFRPHVPIFRGVSKAREHVGKGLETHPPAGAERGNGASSSLLERRGKGPAGPPSRPLGPSGVSSRCACSRWSAGSRSPRSAVPSPAGVLVFPPASDTPLLLAKRALGHAAAGPAGPLWPASQAVAGQAAVALAVLARRFVAGPRSRKQPPPPSHWPTGTLANGPTAVALLVLGRCLAALAGGRRLVAAVALSPSCPSANVSTLPLGILGPFSQPSRTALEHKTRHKRLGPVAEWRWRAARLDRPLALLVRDVWASRKRMGRDSNPR